MSILHQRPMGALLMHSLSRNGANIFCLHLIRGFCAQLQFRVFSPSDGPLRSDLDALGIHVTVMSDASPATLEQHLKAADHSFDFAVLNTIMHASAVSVCDKLCIASLWIIHEAWPPAHFDHYARTVFLCNYVDSHRIRSAFASKATLNCIVFVSKFQQTLYQDLLDSSVQRMIAYNGIPDNEMLRFQQKNDRALVRESLGYSPDDFVVLHLGTVCRRKAQLESVKALAHMQAEQRYHQDFPKLPKLLIVGCRYIRPHEIEYVEEIKRVIVEHQLEQKVKLLDIQEFVFPYYFAADVLLCPSLNEVLPIVICEAMCFGLPIVASNVDAIPEAVDDAVEGFLVPAGDFVAISEKLNTLRSDPTLCKRMSSNGRKRFQRQFSFWSMIALYRSQFQSILSRPLPHLTILVDLDNTIADWDQQFVIRWLQQHAPADANEEQEFRNRISKRPHFELEQNLEPHQRADAIRVMQQPGFYRDLQPIEGALDALREMIQMGITVKIVTAPHDSCISSCVSEKFEWVAHHLGNEWLQRVIVSYDKTVVDGDILVDDKPIITGEATPRWKHVVFTQSYNASKTDTSRISSWTKWWTMLC